MNPQLAKLDSQFKASGLTAVLESGLDPGIDHLLALEAIDQIKSQGHKVRLHLMQNVKYRRFHGCCV